MKKFKEYIFNNSGNIIGKRYLIIESGKEYISGEWCDGLINYKLNHLLHREIGPAVTTTKTV